MGTIPLEKEFKGIAAVRSVINRLLHSLARNLPMYPAWRASIHRMRGIRIGRDVFIGSDVFIDNTYPERIVIEDFVTVISRTFIIGHSFTPVHLKKILEKNEIRQTGVLLKKGCYIGGQSVIMPGVVIGECAIIGAGSVVTRDIPDYSIAAGNPAKVIKTFSKEDVIFDVFDSRKTPNEGRSTIEV